jgi:hypothetical protein
MNEMPHPSQVHSRARARFRAELVEYRQAGRPQVFRHTLSPLSTSRPQRHRGGVFAGRKLAAVHARRTRGTAVETFEDFNPPSVSARTHPPGRRSFARCSSRRAADSFRGRSSRPGWQGRCGPRGRSAGRPLRRRDSRPPPPSPEYALRGGGRRSPAGLVFHVPPRPRADGQHSAPSPRGSYSQPLGMDGAERRAS